MKRGNRWGQTNTSSFRFVSKRNELWMAFVQLEKPFDRVSRDVEWWVLRYVGFEEWIVNVIKSMDCGTITVVRQKNCTSQEIGVKVSVHQGSMLKLT
jgi:hypothetical protein